MSTLGWFACLCACLAVGCAKTAREEGNHCVDENGVSHQAGERYRIKCAYCECYGTWGLCPRDPCPSLDCPRGWIYYFDDPDACCPYCVPDTSRLMNRIRRWHRCENIKCNWDLRCDYRNGYMMKFDPDACCPYCIPRPARPPKRTQSA